MRTSIVTLCSRPRLGHLERQLEAVGAFMPTSGDVVERLVVWIGDDAPPALDAELTVHLPPGSDGLRLAAGRNAGAALAIDRGADLIVFLDADCVPGPALLDRYREASDRHPRAVLCGPVTYLPPGVDVTDRRALAAATAPHAARPNPDDGSERVATEDEYPLFWSLSFATSASTWSRTGGFDEGYEGYGGEDTDFAFALNAAGTPLVWVGGAHAYHQHHETQRPPWQHFDDILRNGARFADRWGTWPMTGWLEAFAEAGAVRRAGDDWVRVQSTTPSRLSIATTSVVATGSGA
ncbi:MULTISPECIES: glycosyltransferase family 2 protein [Plantibacter]|uniref:Glycosyltransferase, GT2 family n=1 Tax=Plantibacter elymi (nom. nud.) TaxID=199708 RepID=A0ABY1REM4_9MICO|nr:MULTISPECIES: galactosyltransferase-related protein [unclassified Plantibacter]MBD8534287.1 glycosyltransferase family 2 protein [Plantibacter sp. CFBP 13570]SMQ66815.1 Glycosyltransferase, GT2 family [Plantibacter sp. VKM Ac-1784]